MSKRRSESRANGDVDGGWTRFSDTSTKQHQNSSEYMESVHGVRTHKQYMVYMGHPRTGPNVRWQQKRNDP